MRPTCLPKRFISHLVSLNGACAVDTCGGESHHLSLGRVKGLSGETACAWGSNCHDKCHGACNSINDVSSMRSSIERSRCKNPSIFNFWPVQLSAYWQMCRG